LLVRRFASMMLVATLITWAAMIGGVYASFWLNSAPAPTIILLLSAMFLLAFARKTMLARRAVSV
jgi:manganese/iron transport system permease protein